MLNFVIGWIVLIIMLPVSFLVMIFMVLLIYSYFMGSPYVGTNNRRLRTILQDAGLKKGQLFIDLGCGDGRVVRMAVKEHGVRGVGVDINPMLITFARMLAFITGLKNAEFKVENIHNTDISKADVIYMFLLPEFLKKLVPKIEKESKKSVLIISHGFTIEGWEKHKIRTLEGKPFRTHFYILAKG